MNLERRIPGFTHAVIDTEDGRCYAGEVWEVTIAGAEFLRLTSPSGQFQFFRGETLARISPCTPAYAQDAGWRLDQPLDHIHLPADEALSGPASVKEREDQAIYQNGYDDGMSAGYEAAMEEYADERAFHEAEASIGNEAPPAGEKQRLLLPGDDGFPADNVREFLREEAA